MPNHTHIRDILDRAADLPSERRPAYLDSACGSDLSLRAEVESLLSQLETAADFTVTAQATRELLTAPSTPPWTNSPKAIGPYVLDGQIGEGGMGTVYRATQEHPIRRTVALKLIRGEFGSAQVIARFEAERQALARMDHPNIAKILDAGTHAGLPFFVMELVDGSPITKFCDQYRLSIPDRLELFAQVCDAIAHAHTKAILHRDIKAGNVLAYMVDGRPRIKVIDFGIAKALTDDRLSDDLARTQEGRPIGTYESMSPEQAAGSLDVDTRTDVYALGVLLYELLCGFKPFAGKMIVGMDVLEVQRLIRDVDPPRPSTRVSPSADDSRTPDIADVRQTTPIQLTKRLRSELEWIPLKAVRKERDRRYESAAQLSTDVRNYLVGMPLIAGPDSRRYRAGKIVRRNKGVLAAAAAVLAVLVLGITGTTIGLVREAKARQVAENQTREADRQRNEAESQRDNAAAVRDFLTDDVLEQASPARTFDKASRDVLVHSLLVPAGERVQSRFAGKPLLEASVRNMLAVVYFDLGPADLALPHARAAYELRLTALGPDHLDTIGSEDVYATALRLADRSKEAEPLFVDALGRSVRVSGQSSPTTLRLLNNYGQFLRGAGRTFEAQPLFQTALARSRAAMGESDVLTLTSLNNDANALCLLGHVDQASDQYRELWRLWRKSSGDDHFETLNALDCYSVTLALLGRAVEAEPLSKQAWQGRLRVLGEGHPDTVQSMSNYAQILQRLGRSADAEPLAFKSWQQKQAMYGDDAPAAVESMNDYAVVLRSLNRPAEAVPLLEKFWRFEIEHVGAAAPQTASARDRLVVAVMSVRDQARSLMTAGHPAEAEPLLKLTADETRKVFADPGPETIGAGLELLNARRVALGSDHPDTVQSLCDCAAELNAQGRAAEAEPLAREASERRERLLGRSNAATITARYGHARTLISLDRITEAEQELGKSLSAAVVNPHLGAADPLTAQIAESHARCLDILGDRAAAEGNTDAADTDHETAARERRRFGPAGGPAATTQKAP